MSTNMLHAAVTAGDRAQVEQLLADGASALEVLEPEGSLLRLAHAGLDRPDGRVIVNALRSAARAEAESRARLSGSGVVDGDMAPGVSSLRGAAGDGLGVVLLEGPAALTAKTLASLLQAPRREADVGARGVMDAARLLFCLKMKEAAWTVVPIDLAPNAPWNLGEITELNRRGSGLEPLCRALAETAERRVIHVEADAFTVYGSAGTIERHTDADEGAPTLNDLGVQLPAMRIHTDGHDVQLELTGVSPDAVERLDLVALQEFGEPRLDRRPGAAPGMPKMVAPGGQALLAEAPPARVEPVASPTDPPSMVPIVGSQPPPMVTKEVTQNEIVSPPPRPPKEPVVETPSPAAPSAPPPLVSAEVVVPNAEPDPPAESEASEE
ncbi:MAG: hypothetical protein AB8I08_39065 [Sandaracinaceae bacterium]